MDGHDLTFTSKERNEMLIYACHILITHERTVNLSTLINVITAHKTNIKPEATVTYFTSFTMQ